MNKLIVFFGLLVASAWATVPVTSVAEVALEGDLPALELPSDGGSQSLPEKSTTNTEEEVTQSPVPVVDQVDEASQTEPIITRVDETPERMDVNIDDDAKKDADRIISVDIMISNESKKDLYTYFAKKQGFGVLSANSIIKASTRQSLPINIALEKPILSPSNHLSNIKQFNVLFSTNNENGTWGLFSKQYDVQLDAYFSSWGLQAVLCYGGEGVSCQALLDAAKKKVSVKIILK